MKATAKCFVSNVALILLALLTASHLSATPFAAADDTNNTNTSPTAIRDLTLTLKEKRFLEQFKDVVEPYLENQHERFREDAYLIRWLRASEFDVKKAEKKLLANLRWREKHRMDSILDEDWSDFFYEFPYSISSYDKHNQPVLTNQMGTWDFRQVVLSGKRDRMLRYVFRMLEGLDQEIYNQQMKGRLVTRSVELTDLAGFNLYQHGCMQCIPLYIEMVLGLDAYYPGLIDKIVMVNAPGVFEAILNAVKPSMAPETRNSMFVFGTNSKLWRAFVNKIIDSDELPVEFGGNKVFLEYNGV